MSGRIMLTADSPEVQVYNIDAGRIIEVSADEARAGMVRYARSLGAGSAACGAWEQRSMWEATS